ncbi:MAG: MFS transporter [Simkaniaceae bacterium]
MEKKRCIIRWLIWSFAVLFYLYEYILRVVPSVMVGDLMSSFSVTAGQLGLLSAFYLYAYAPMQIPVGILMDRYGARRLLTFAATVCGIGSFIFGFSSILSYAAFGRLLMGTGSAFAFVGVVYICSHWFESKKLALLVGLANSFGMVGAFCGQGPISYIVDRFGWRETSIYLGVLGFIIAFIIYLVMRNEPKRSKKEIKADKKNELSTFQKIKVVSRNPRTWINSLIALSFYATTVAFAGLWAVPFLMKKYELSKDVAGFGSSMIFLGWIIGGPIIGHFSDKAKKRKPMLFLFALFCLGAMLGLIYFVNIPVWFVYFLLFSIGFCQSAELLCYCLAVELNPQEAKGTSIALTNFMVFLAGSIIQPLVGYLLDLNWNGAKLNGEPLYSIHDFQIAMLIFPITLALAAIFTLFLKEKRHHEYVESQY